MPADSRGGDSEADLARRESEQPESGQEVTPVGRVSKNLLELSSTEDANQNTRAYQAPAELLELARRQRERAKAKPGGSLPPNPASLAPKPASLAPKPASLAPKRASPFPKPASLAPKPASAPPKPASLAPPVPTSEAPRPGSTPPKPASVAPKPAPTGVKRLPIEVKVRSLEAKAQRPSSAEGDAAPPRPIGESLAPRERPTRRPGRSDEVVESSAPSISVNPASSSDSVNYLDDGEPADSAADDAAPPVARSRPSRALSDMPGPESAARPPSLRELALAASDRQAPRSIAAASEERSSQEVASSGRISTTGRPRTYYWALLVLVFIALGFALAKTRALDLLLPR